MRLEGRRTKPDITDERPARAWLRSPQAPALTGDLGLEPPRQRVAFGSGEAAGHELHHLRIGIEGREGRKIALTPLTQPQAWAAELDHVDRCLQELLRPVLSDA